MAAVLAKKELLVGSDDCRHTLTKGCMESGGLRDFRFFLLNHANRLPAGKGILERFLFSACEARERENSQEFSACEATPERLRMLTTVLDPSQSGGRFLLVGHRNGQCTIFSGLIERRLRISQGGGGREDRPVHKRLEDFQRIAGCLVKDLGMPISIQGGFHCLNEYRPNNCLLGWLLDGLCA